MVFKYSTEYGISKVIQKGLRRILTNKYKPPKKTMRGASRLNTWLKIRRQQKFETIIDFFKDW